MENVTGTAPPPVSELGTLAEDWLAVKRVARGSSHSDRARNADLRRWAGVIVNVVGREYPESLSGPINGLRLWDYVMVTELADTDVILRAFDRLGSELAPKSLDRVLTVLGGWSGWLVRREVLHCDPTDNDDLQIRAPKTLGVRACTPENVEALLHAASIENLNASSAWPSRDAAIVATLAGTGLRAAELCALTINDVDRNVERPLARIKDAAKGGDTATFPSPAGSSPASMSTSRNAPNAP